MRTKESKVSLFASLLAMIVGAILAFILGMLGGLNEPKRAIVMCAAAVVVGGIVFSILELSWRRNSKEVMDQSESIDRFEAELAERRAKAESATLPEHLEPYRHHEQHPESPGFDQGQLTSNLPGTTPFFDDDPNGTKHVPEQALRS